MEIMSINLRTHKELAEHIKPCSVLHLNSLGKDSAACLEWLANYAKPKRIVSVNYQFLSEHPSDVKYLEYQKKRYPNVEFIREPNAHELTNICRRHYQTPDMVMSNINNFEHHEFSFKKYSKDLLKKLNLDYACSGFSKYESVSRATNFYKKGLVINHEIFPIGMMTKAQVMGIISQTGLKLHPCYKLSQTTHDYPSYYKMRSAFIADPEFKKSVYKVFPLLVLDEYRFEVLLNGKKTSLK